MKKMSFIAAAVCVLCLITPFTRKEISLGMAQEGQRLTPQEAIDAARRNSKAGSSFTVLREIVADADTRRVGDQALEQARAHQIKLWDDGILADLLRSGGFLIAEYDPKTTNTIALHLVSLEPDGVPNDDFYPSAGVVKLADAEELVKDTAEFTEELYSTSPPDTTSLERRFYGGSFPECGPEECGLFGVPRSLLKLGADQSECREVAALSSGLVIRLIRYAVSMPAFAANPLVTTQAAADKLDALEAKFLRNNHMNPDLDFDPEEIQSEKQLRERIDLLRRMDKFLEEAFQNDADLTIVKANLSVATIPLGVGAYIQDGQVLYGSGTASLIVIYWQQLSTSGFAVYGISEADDQ